MDVVSRANEAALDVALMLEDAVSDNLKTIQALTGENLRRLLLRKGMQLYDYKTKRFDMPYHIHKVIVQVKACGVRVLCVARQDGGLRAEPLFGQLKIIIMNPNNKDK